MATFIPIKYLEHHQFTVPVYPFYGSINICCKVIFKLVVLSVFAFGENYWVLFVARAVQGIGSSCSSVAGKANIRVILTGRGL